MPFARLCLLALFWLLGTGIALAESRVAFVVGNAAYERTSPLANPLNDAIDVAALLDRLGFDVVLGTDLDEETFSRKLADFSGKARNADVALFYYAGHGIQYEGRNYLIPVDAGLEDQFSLRRETLPLDEVLAEMERASIGLVFIDACRNNIFADNLRRVVEDGGGRSAAVGRGLARVDAAARDMLIAFAAGPGAIASDGLGRNSPFTGAILDHLGTPGIEISTALKRVTADVRLATDGDQQPEQLTSMGTEFYMVPQGTVAEPGVPSMNMEELAFATAREIGTAAAWDGFIASYPDSTLRGIAEAARSKVANIDPVIPPADPVRIEAPAGGRALLFPPGSGAFSWQPLQHFADTHTGLRGETLDLWGPWQDQDQDAFETVLAYFEAATGITVEYATTDYYESELALMAAAGSLPNITLLPQPGLFAELASDGYLTPLGETVRDRVEREFSAGTSYSFLGTFEGPDRRPDFYAVPYKMEVKSLVWYAPDAFRSAGYQVPRTYEELKALTEEMVADGNTPWCIGLGSGGATGWPATDWVENIMLRLYPPEIYDAWLLNDLKFNDPLVVAAIEEFGWFALDDEKVAGGAASVGASDFRESPLGLFSTSPACYMHHQAAFIPAFFPEGISVGRDADFFYLPSPASRAVGNPVLGSGTLAAITRDSPAARAFIDFLLTPIAHEVWMAQSGFLSPLKGANAATYRDEITRRQGQILRDATTFRFDGSDLMPAVVGAGTFWTGMVDYVGGVSAQKVADGIQASWESAQ